MTQRNTAAVKPQGFEPVNGGCDVAGCIEIFLFDVIFQSALNRYGARRKRAKLFP
jgi:hypothetical protein